MSKRVWRIGAEVVTYVVSETEPDEDQIIDTLALECRRGPSFEDVGAYEVESVTRMREHHRRRVPHGDTRTIEQILNASER